MTCRTLHIQASESMKSSLLNVENGLMDTVGEGKGGTNWVGSIDIYIQYMCKTDT